jgi:hypothetical protein
MTTKDEFVRDVTEFLSATKELAGIDMPVVWQPGREPSELCAKLPIEINGVLSGKSLLIVSFPASDPLRFTILIIHEVAICRLDFDESGGHTNGFSQKKLPEIISGSHFHRWSSNMQFVTDYGKLPTLKFAEALPKKIRSFDTALRWFCAEVNISLPNTHLITLPPRVLI